MIEFRTLGAVSLKDAGAGDVDSVLAQPKRLALLAYLALARPRGFHRRNTLLAMFWPEDDEKHARWSLNQALRHLRKGLGREAILSRGTDEVGLDFDAIRSDVHAFEQACDEGKPETALDFYRGHLLEGFHAFDCADFEHWLDGERARLRRRAVEAAWKLTDRHQGEGELVAAAASARRAVDLSEHDEKGIRRLIELLDGAGNRAAALRAYESYAARLRDILDVEPAPETQELIASLRSRQPNHAVLAPVTQQPVSGGVATGLAEPERVGDNGVGLASSRRHLRYLVSVAAMAVIAILALAALPILTADRGLSCASPETWVGTAAPGVAVLPFTVSGSEVDELGEGMVHLLSANLEGLDGIRPISPFTVLARWSEHVPDTAQADLATRLEVAQCLGAEYAVVGSAVAVGATLRLTASLHESGRTESIGQANETAHRDSLWGALDRLSIGLIRGMGTVVLGELSRLDSKEITTGSPDALRAYLRAQALYRRGEFESSAFEYEQAIAEDSTFSLAHLGLGWTLAWEPLVSTDRSHERPGHWQAALDHSRTERQALIARASLTHDGEFMSADMAGELLEAAGRYPDDAHLWYLLGEHYLHVGTATGAFDSHVEKAERAFERAVALVPDFVPYWAHLMDLALIRADSLRAEEVVAGVSRFRASDSRTARNFRALQRVFFLASPGTEAFEAALDTLQGQELRRLYWSILSQPDLWTTAEAVIERLRATAETRWKDCWWVQRSLTPGLLATYLAEATAPPADDYCLYLAQMFGLPVPEELVDSVMTARLDSMVAGGAEFRRDLGLPLYFAERGRWPEHDTVLALWRAGAAAALEADGIDVARRWGHFVTAAEGYGEWKRGRPERALAILEGLPPEARNWPPVIRWWLGTLYMEFGRPAEAVRQFRTLQGAYPAPNWTLAYLRAGEAYEQLGEMEKAREQYAYFVEAWKDSDPELQPWVERGRARLEALNAPRE
jgi:serine/threonine-protein kinase